MPLILFPVACLAFPVAAAALAAGVVQIPVTGDD